MTTNNDTTTAAETVQDTAQLILQVADLPTRIQALDAKIDAALATSDTDVDRHQIRRELDMIAIAEGGEAGRLALRYQELVSALTAVLDADAPRKREEAKVVWESEVDGFHFAMDADGNLAFGDVNDDDGPVVELDRRQAVATMKFWGEIFKLGIQVVRDERKVQKSDVTPLEHTPLAVNHTIDGVICELRPDGELTLCNTHEGLVRLEPREAYALAMFMRSPAAVALLEAQNAARQTRSELDFQADPETIAERAASAR